MILGFKAQNLSTWFSFDSVIYLGIINYLFMNKFCMIYVSYKV